MYRILVALALASALAACDPASLSSGDGAGIGSGAQPLIPEPAAEPVTTDPNADPDPDTLLSSEVSSEADLTVDAMSYDPTTDEVVFNNLPFDSNIGIAGENTYRRNAGPSASIAGTGFGAYRSAAGPAGASQYFAVFRRSATGFSQVGAVGTDRYLSFGFGGAVALRLNGDGSLPATNDSYVFTGEYAAVRTVVDDTTGTRMEYVSGISRIDVDIQDFDVSGAVEGLIVSRQFFDENGINIAALNGADFISLATAEINFDTWTISSSDASVVRSDGEVNQTGNWSGLFAGPNGEEIVGIVVVEGQGPVGIDPATGEFITLEVREVGGFIATR